MKKNTLLFVYILTLSTTYAQITIEKPIYRVGIFTSLYLDSAYKQGKYQFNESVPKFILKGLDFAVGARLAIDTIQSVDSNSYINYTIFDIQSKNSSIQKLQDNKVFDSLDLIIGNVSGLEFKQLANIACPKNIPFVSVTYPNDAGISNCSSVILLNPTIQVHCEKMYNYLLENDAFANKIFISKDGVLETRIKLSYDKLNKGSGTSTLLSWKEYNVMDSTENIDEEYLTTLLDSTKKNVIICGSLDEKFSIKLIKAAAGLNKYEITLYGMPSWETISETDNKSNQNLKILYTTSFYNTRKQTEKKFEDRFIRKTNSRPSDYAYKAYESTLYFSRLLMRHGSNINSHLDDTEETIFTPYVIKPVYSQASATVLFRENKNVHIIQHEKGVKTQVTQQ
jgi:ABC-type branched-subunit amino acid transport system substrate-binding protein